MAKKIENLPTTEIVAYIQAADNVISKCNSIFNVSKDIKDQEAATDSLQKIFIIRRDHFNLMNELQTELEKRMKKHFELKYSATNIEGILKTLQKKIDAELEKMPKGTPMPESPDQPEGEEAQMKVVK